MIMSTDVEKALDKIPQHLLTCSVVSHTVASNSLRAHGLYPARLLCPWNSPGKNTDHQFHSPGNLLGLNLGLLCHRWIFTVWATREANWHEAPATIQLPCHNLTLSYLLCIPLYVSHHPCLPSFSVSHQPSLTTHFLNPGYVFHNPHPPSAIILTCSWLISSVVHLLFSRWVVSNYLWLHGLQHARLPYPSLSPGVCSNSCPSSLWCHPTMSFSVTPFSSCAQSLPAWGSFPMSWLFPSGGQSVGVSASASVLPVNIQGWFPLGLTGLISFQSRGPSRVFSCTTVWKASIFWHSDFFMVQLPIPTWLPEKP